MEIQFNTSFMCIKSRKRSQKTELILQQHKRQREIKWTMFCCSFPHKKNLAFSLSVEMHNFLSSEHLPVGLAIGLSPDLCPHSFSISGCNRLFRLILQVKTVPQTEQCCFLFWFSKCFPGQKQCRWRREASSRLNLVIWLFLVK